jgi:hypothetical protein
LVSDIPNDLASAATGSGKTVVMAMITAWSVLNKVYNRQDKRFSDAILVVCPNLTVKKRLSVLIPSDPSNYYQKFEIIPRSLFSMLSKGKNDESKRTMVKTFRSFKCLLSSLKNKSS